MEEVPALAKYVRRYDYVVAKDGSILPLGDGVALSVRK